MVNKLYSLKKKLYFMRLDILFNKAMKEGKITGFDEEIYERMGDTIIACLPVHFYIKYSEYLFDEGTCYDRSLYMFLALDDALFVTGDNKDLEYNYGKGHEEHAWVEIGDFVYDPSLMLKFDKDTYYSLYGCSNVTKTDKQTYLLQNGSSIDKYVSHGFDEFKPNGERRLELGVFVKQIRALSQMVDNEQFSRDFNNYLASVEYDEEQIAEERQKFMQKIWSNTSAMTVFSGSKR
ncbi:MAG: hypothetical protein IJO43_03475 [Bacilli bacterium]|nr:hypothetical protein [Bacilli bacterium]